MKLDNNLLMDSDIITCCETTKDIANIVISAKSENIDQLTFKSPIISGIQRTIIRYIYNLGLVMFLIRKLLNPFKVIYVLERIKQLRSLYIGNRKKKKFVKSDGRYYYDLHIPGYPSSASTKFLEGLLNRIYTFRPDMLNLQTIILAVTRKCPLRCEHCFEWEALDGKEKLSINELKKIIQIFQDKGVTQIQISGGEPLMRIDDVVELIRSAKPGTDFLLLTSGYNLTPNNARRLKEAGLTGLTISLDHFQPHLNNKIKGHASAYNWAMSAIKNAHKAKLVVSLSLCSIKDFLTEENLMKYMEYAKRLGIAFVHILEPRNISHMNAKDFELSEEQENLLENFYLKMNFDTKYKDMPIITYHGFYQRRIGCVGAGNRYLYIDTEGDLHACPFCRKKSGNVLSSPIDKLVENLKAAGCHKYNSFNDEIA